MSHFAAVQKALSDDLPHRLLLDQAPATRLLGRKCGSSPSTSGQWIISTAVPDKTQPVSDKMNADKKCEE